MFFCCAEDNEVHLVAVVEALREEGGLPEVLTGVDVEPRVLTDAVDRNRGPGLYVLCRSPQLDDVRVRRLDGLFSARRGPAHRLLPVRLNTERPLTMMPIIRDGIREVGMSQSRPDPRDGPPSGEHLRDVVGPMHIDAVSHEGASTDSADDLARKLARELEATEAALIRRERARHEEVERRREAPSAARQESNAPPVIAPSASSSGRAPGEASSSTDVPDEALATAPANRRLPRPKPAAETPSRAGGVDGTSDRSRDPREPLVGSWGLLAAGALVIAGAVVAVLYTMDDPLEVSVHGRGPGEPRDPATGPRWVDAPSGPRLAMPDHVDGDRQRDTAHSSSAETSGLRPTNESPPSEAVLIASDRRPKPEAGEALRSWAPVPPPPARSSKDAERNRAIDAAIEAGRIRTAGSVLWLEPSQRVADLEGAAGLCEVVTVDGIGGWRLPTKHQLASLRGAAGLPMAVYWSRTLGTEPSQAWVLDGREIKTIAVDDRAHALCVRKR